jgi:hypothetical protein
VDGVRVAAGGRNRRRATTNGAQARNRGSAVLGGPYRPEGEAEMAVNPDGALRQGVPWARMYRVVHGWPMLVGIPIPSFLLLMLVGIVGVFGASMFGGLITVGLVTLSVVLSWLGLALVFRQDQVTLPLFLVTRRARLGRIISSFNPSWVQVVFEEEERRG